MLKRFFLLLILSHQAAFAVGAAIDLSNRSPEQAKEFVQKTLDKLDASYYEDDETEGFQYRINTSWYSVYSFDIFIGTYGDDFKTLVRVDAPHRMGFALGDILLQENGSKQFKKKYQPKSVFLGDSLTLLSPSLGYIYTNTNTPFAPKTIWARSLLYLGIDAFLFWMGSKVFFTEPLDPTGKGLVPMAALMGAFRLWALIPHHMQLVANNRMVGAGYSFRF